MYVGSVIISLAVLAYEKAEEILLHGDEDIDRPDLLSLVKAHHAQCILLGSSEEYGSGKEPEGKELEEIISKLNESMTFDVRQASVWNTLGVLLLKADHLRRAISVLSSLLAVAPENLDCIGNLGMAHLQKHMKDGRFWRIYFTLVSAHVSPYILLYDVGPEVTGVELKSKTSSEQDLDSYLLGDLDDSDGHPDEDAFDDDEDDFDKIDNSIEQYEKEPQLAMKTVLLSMLFESHFIW